MASTNKTENIGLNQWVASDPVLREDFNADNAKIDAALGAVNDTLATELEQFRSGLLKIASGSYVGTGEYGASAPNSLTFDFAPYLVIITFSNYTAFFCRGSAYACGFTATGASFTTTALGWYLRNVSWGDNTLSWYSTDGSTGVDAQLNYNGRTYSYIAIGM